MLTEYEANFTISETLDIEGSDLLVSVADKLESLLSDSQDDDSSLIAERETMASSGYAIVNADRLHPINSDFSVRLEARLCTEGREVTAQIRTRFISADDNDPADLTAGPPLILKEIVDSYDCRIGTYQFKGDVFQVKDGYTAERVLSFIKNPSRKIPVLVLTEDNTGHTAIEPQNALDYLLGLALVVRFEGGTSEYIKDATGQACYNGAMRFYWPGGSVSKFYWPSDAAGVSITQFQKDCIENVEVHDLNGDFEQMFSAARTRVIRERREEAYSATSEELDRAKARIRELERLLESSNDAKSMTDIVSDAEKDKEIRRKNTAINQLKRLRRIDEETIRKLTQTTEELRMSLERAEAEADAAKTPTIVETPRGAELELTGKASIDNITLLNHAINIYRNPVRRYIIRSLRKSYGDCELYNAIGKTMKDDDLKRLRQAVANNRPQDGIDVGNFEHIVMENRICFGGSTRLTTRLEDVRQVRNTAAHPDTNGLNYVKTKYGLNKISRALKEMDNTDDSKLVERLLPLVR